MSDFQTRFNNSNNYWKPQSPSLIEQNEVICNGFLFYQQNSTFFILTSQKLIKFINCLDVSYVYLSYFTIKYLSTTSIHLQKEELEIILESDHSTITYWYQNLKNKCVQINFFANYQLSKQIGKGQFATVYEAINILTQSKYAVKVIRRNQRLEEDDIHQEIAIMRTIQNPFVLKIIEVFTDNNNYYIVTELLENTLSKLPKLTEYECCQIIIQILLGLKCIHNKNIFHRDLKPENIFFKQANKYEITLGDFGLADYIKQDQNYKFTKCGTPGFVAPEILRNNQYDLKVDIYSIGIVLFYLLTQNSPFSGRNQQEIIQKNLKSNVNFDLLNVTSACQELLQDLLQPNPQDRPTANEALHYQWFYQTLGSEVYQSILIQHNETQLLEQYLQITNTTRSVISSSQTIYLRQEQEIQQKIEEKQISQIYLLKQTLIQQFAKMIQ